MSASSVPAGLLLTILGVWVLLQTLVGGLAARILALSPSSKAAKAAAAPPKSGLGKAVALGGGALGTPIEHGLAHLAHRFGL